MGVEDNVSASKFLANGENRAHSVGKCCAVFAIAASGGAFYLIIKNEHGTFVPCSIFLHSSAEFREGNTLDLPKRAVHRAR